MTTKKTEKEKQGAADEKRCEVDHLDLSVEALNTQAANDAFVEMRSTTPEARDVLKREVEKHAVTLLPAMMARRQKMQPSSQVSIEDAAKDAVKAALTVLRIADEDAETRRKRLSGEAVLNEELDRYLEHQDKLRKAVWSPVEREHRKRRGLPPEETVEKVDVLVYLKHVIPKLRGGDAARTVRFTKFLSVWRPSGGWRTPQPFSHDVVMAKYADGLSFGFIHMIHDDFIGYCREYGKQQMVEGARRGGKSRHGREA